ncbi:MAG: alkaline phosphatase PhoX, partial [Porticoccaceae bacterium]
MKNRNGTDLGRRRLLWGAAAGAGGVALAPILYRLRGKLRDQGGDLQRESPYGLPAPTPDQATGLPLLKLPPDFSYTSAGWLGDPMSDGYPTPDRHDGMGVIQTGPGGDITLIRNHERGLIAPGKPMPCIGGPATPCYDNLVLPGRIAGSGGGTTALRFREGELIDARATLAGTLVNCSGGPTGFGSWLSCEEIVLRGSLIGARDHGWVFEVPAPELGPASARPIPDMGLMRHEATARDPATGLIYLTEDNGAHSGFYRFTPHDRAARIGALEAGGQLAMLKVVGRDNVDLSAPEIGATFAVEWVSIPDPDADPERLEAPAPGLPKIRGAGKSGPFLQGEARGAAGFRRGEGCHYHQGVIYMVDTSGGAAGAGAVWAYQDRPAQGGNHGTLT